MLVRYVQGLTPCEFVSSVKAIMPGWLAFRCTSVVTTGWRLCRKWIIGVSSENRLYVKVVIGEAGQWVRRLVGQRGEEQPCGGRLHQRIEWIYGLGIDPTLREYKGQKNVESKVTDQK